MSINELESKVRELRQLQALIDEATAEAESLRDEIKAYMGKREVVNAGEYKVTWRTVKAVRIDTGAMRKAYPEIVQEFSRESSTRRFCVA